MTWPPNPSALVLGAIVAASIALAAASWTQRGRTRAARSFTFLVLATALWAVAEGAQAIAVDPVARLTWLQLELLAAATLPVAFLIFAIDDARRFVRLDRHGVALLLVVPAVSVALAWSFPLQDALWQAVATDGGRMVPSHGPWWWVHAAYGYALAVAGTAVLAAAQVASRRPPRAPGAWALAGAVAVWVAHAVAAGFADRLPFDPTPFVAFLAVAVVARGLLVHRVRDVLPVAREAVLRQLPDPILVLDAWRRVLQANAVAAEVFEVDRPDDLIGRDADEVLREQPALRRAVEVGASVELAFEWSGAPVQRHFRARTTPLADRRGRRSGQVLHLQDVGREMLAERERRATESELIAQRAFTSALLAASQGLVAGLPVEELLETLLRRAAEVVGTPHAALFRTAADGSLERWRALGRLVSVPDGPAVAGADLAARAANERRPVVVPVYAAWPERTPGLVVPWARAALAVPLSDGRDLHGVLVFVRARDDLRPFSGAEEAVALGLARLAAVAVGETQRADALAGLRRDADAHGDAVAAMRSDGPLHERLDGVLAAARTVVGFGRAVVWLPDEDGVALRPERTMGFGDAVRSAGAPVPLDGSVPLLEAAFVAGEAHVLDGTEPVPAAWRAHGAAAASEFVRSRAPSVVPMVARGRTVGVLAVDDPFDRTPLAPRLADLRRFATFAAVVVDQEPVAAPPSAAAPALRAPPPWRFEALAFAEIVRHAARIAGARGDRQPGVDLHLDVPYGLPPVIGDRERLLLVAVHLIARALAETRVGSVTLSLGRDHDRELGDALVLRVRDTGDGGGAEELARAFDEPAAGGTPVLHACRRTVERHGGRLWSNRSARGGATVAIVLPVVADATQAVATMAEAAW
jgi:PAS domain-containing protein